MISNNSKASALKKDFIRYMIPSVLAQWVFALYTMVDGMFVARGVSETALAGVNIAAPFLNLLFSISLMFAVGSSTMIAIFLGQKENENANRIYTQNTVVLFLLSLVMMVVVLTHLDSLGRFLGATPETEAYVHDYIRTLAWFTPFFTLTYSYEVLVKVDGAPKLSMFAVSVGALINLVLDYLFVMVFHWGVFGAAFATGLSQAVVLCIYFAYMLSQRATLRFARFRMDFHAFVRTIKLGLASGVTEWSAGIVIFLFNHAILRHIGQEALVSYTVAAYVSTLALMSMAGVAQGFQPLVSYAWGQGDLASCKKLLRYGIIAGLILSLSFTAVSVLVANDIVSIYIAPEFLALRQYSVRVLRIFSISFVLAMGNVVIGGYFTAIERPKASLAVSAMRGFLAPALALQLMTAIFGGEGVWWAATLSECLCLVLTAVLWRRVNANLPKSFPAYTLAQSSAK